MKSTFHIMLIPTLGCPAHCKYCWSSDERSPRMSIETIKDVVEWLKDFRDDQVTVTFHGGEPLLAGEAFYQEALPLLADGLSHLHPTFAIQTNLWLLTPGIADLFAKYNIPVGSSIDGPKEICDLQRGEGYYERTMQGYELAREHGLDVRFICTFTSYSVEHKDEIFNFFLENNLTLKLHPALPSLRDSNPDEWTLTPEKYGELLVYLLDQSLEHLGEIEVMNINDLCRGVFTRHGTVCTYADCMGNTFAIGPDGSIYPCYRFVGMPEFVMGNVATHPSREELEHSAVWKQMEAFKAYVDEHCKDCAHIKYCRGGCPYNAIAPTGGEVKGVDPHCPAYARIFEEIGERINKEMFESSPFLEMGGPRSRRARDTKPGVMALIRQMAMR